MKPAAAWGELRAGSFLNSHWVDVIIGTHAAAEFNKNQTTRRIPDRAPDLLPETSRSTEI